MLCNSFRCSINFPTNLDKYWVRTAGLYGWSSFNWTMATLGAPKLFHQLLLLHVQLSSFMIDAKMTANHVKASLHGLPYKPYHPKHFAFPKWTFAVSGNAHYTFADFVNTVHLSWYESSIYRNFFGPVSRTLKQPFTNPFGGVSVLISKCTMVALQGRQTGTECYIISM